MENIEKQGPLLLLIAPRQFGATQELSVLVETREELPVLCFECRPLQALQKGQAQWHARLAAVVCQHALFQQKLQQVEVS